MAYVAIAIGSALGGLARHWLSSLISEAVPSVFPWGTLLINVSGSFAILLFSVLTASEGRFPVSGEWRLFFVTGICGGYTTFSTFSLQTLDLLRTGAWGLAGLNILSSVGLCLIGAGLGYGVGTLLNTTG